jgi:hypothetical protein
MLMHLLVMQYFCDTVTEMARRQFVSGSPLRTLSLLLAGQPVEVFATPSLQSGSLPEGVRAASDQSQVSALSHVSTIHVYL